MKNKEKVQYYVASQATKFRRELNLPETLEPKNEAQNVYARKGKQKAKRLAQSQLKRRWKDKPMHGGAILKKSKGEKTWTIK